MKEVSVHELAFNPMDLIAQEWMLVTAGTKDRGYNTMTASWGHLGSIWGHGGGLPTSVVYLRPQRYTKEFMDREAYYTLSFFPEKFKKDLGYLGAHSGREEPDKVSKTSLTAVFEQDWTYFAEAKLVLVCRKLYHGALKEEGFVDRQVMEESYPNRDFHTMYVGEIVKVLASEDWYGYMSRIPQVIEEIKL